MRNPFLRLVSITVSVYFQTLSEYLKNPSVKLLVAISTSFFVTSCPLMVVITIDVISVEFVFIRYSVTVVLAISLLYGLVVPFILALRMPSLRAAIRSWFFSFKCCTRSTVHVHKTVTVT